jgi:flap endonuclease-1
MIIGTDFNIGGIKGLGPKKGLTLVKEYGEKFDELFKFIKWDEHFDVSWKEVYELVSNIPTTDDYDLVWEDIDKEAVINLLVTQHDFSQERILNTLEELEKNKLKSQQTSLGKFFG